MVDFEEKSSFLHKDLIQVCIEQESLSYELPYPIRSIRDKLATGKQNKPLY